VDPIKVLVVDDERDFLDALVVRLKLRKYQVEGAPSGEEALEVMGERPADVVVLDLKMPGMDGIETLTEIKKRHTGAEVVILTGHGDVEAGMEGLSRGAFAYLIKPVKVEELIEKIVAAYDWSLVAKRTGRDPEDA
jgi:two-component system OmpR family response regulator